MENSLAAVLHGIQRNLKAPKDKTNTFGKFKYRSCESILEAVKKEIPDGVHLTLSDTMVQVGERVYVKATASLATSEDIVSVDGWAREAEVKKGMDDAQITGAASSYARKYALCGLFAIDDTKDADETNTGKAPDIDEALANATSASSARAIWKERKAEIDEIQATDGAMYQRLLDIVNKWSNK